MRWNVEGADGQTGEERVIAVEAETQAEAEAEARRQGLLISSVHKAATQSVTDQLDETIESGPILEPATINYRNVRTLSAAIPNYSGLKIGASVLSVFAVLYYVFGGILILLGSLGVVGMAIPSATIGLGYAGIAGIFWGLFFAMIGGLLHALSAAALALCDIARNSFVTANAVQM